MNKDCEKYKELILEQLDNNREDENILLEHVRSCPSCLKFYEELKQIQGDLQAFGTLIRENLPKIDIVNNIKKEVERIKNSEVIINEIIEKEDKIPEFIEWHSYIENELDDVSRYRCEMQLEQSPRIKQEIGYLSVIHHAMEEIGNAWSAPSLDEDLSPKIMEKVQQYKLNSLKEQKEKEIEEIDEIEEELFELAHTVSNSIKEIDLTVPIKKHIARVLPKTEKLSQRNIVHLLNYKREKESKKPLLKQYAIPFSIAVAFVLTVLGIFVYTYFLQVHTDVPSFITAQNNENKKTSIPSKKEYEIAQPFYTRDDVPISVGDEVIKEKRSRNRTSNYPEGLVSTWSKQLKDNALTNAGKLMRMGVWATLTPEEARDLLQKSGLSPEAILGAVQFLPPEEARVVLQAAIDSNPNDAYLRYAMVQTLRKMDNASEDELNTHLTAWSQLDPGNALPHFIEAEMCFRNGEAEKALTCVTDAQKASNYNSYASITAKAYMEALLAKGVDAETAKLLASASMGLHEVQTIEEIAQTLMEYGKAYEEAGDYSTALMIYDALRNLGIKVDMSSNLIQEKLAGLKYTQEAVNAMFRLLNTTNSLSDAQSLIDFTQTLSEMIANYNLALESFYRLFDTTDPSEIIQLLNLYLSNGNINLYTNQVSK